MDMKAICDGLATRYAAMTPPSGETLRAAYGQEPKSMPDTPAIVFFPQDGDMTLGTGQWEGEHRIDLCLYLSKRPGDPSRVETQRQKWLGPLLSRLDGQMAIGLAPTVLKAYPTSYEWTERQYDGAGYDGILVHLVVNTRENATFAP